MATPDVPIKASSWRYETGSLFLAALTVFFSYMAGRLLGFESARLIGYSLGPLFVVLIVLGISRLVKAARTRSATARISFFTLLVVLPLTVFSAMQANYERSSISTEFDQDSFAVEEAQASALALRIQDSVTNGDARHLEPLYDGDRFMKRILRGHDTTSGNLRDIAQGGRNSFEHGKLLEQMASLVQEDGEFGFVKSYRKGQDSILQFRLHEDSGNLHYLDIYIFKASDGNIRIEDFHYYNSGEPVSKQVVENATGLQSRAGSTSTEDLRKAIQLSQEGRMEEAHTILESLPDALKQERVLMRLRIRLAYHVDVDQADRLLNEFKNRFPDDPGIVFSAFTATIAKGDLGGSAALIDDIYKAVNGDEYLLWYRVNLSALQKKYDEATALLSEMESRYRIDVASAAESKLVEELLSSREYKVWLDKHTKK